jgi:peptidoglycan/LPS O-acetylase OafA/YrhL
MTPPLPWTHSIRALACVTVVVWHAVLTILPEGTTGAWHLPFLGLGTVAREAVLVFVILSAYLLGRHWRGGLNDSSRVWSVFRQYLGRRLWRIVPPFWAAVTITIIVMLAFGLDRPEGSHWDTGLPLTPWRAVANYLMVTDIVGIVPVSHPLWTVPVELHLYLLAPLIVLCVARWRIILVASVLCVAVALSAPWFTAPYFLFSFMTSFWLGARRQDWETPTRRATLRLMAPIAAVSLVLLVVVTAAHALPDGPNKYFVTDALVGPVFVAWLFHRDVSGKTTRVVTLLGHRSMVWLGERSYSIYLIHALILECAWRFGVRPLSLGSPGLELVVLIVAGTPLSLIGGAALYHLVEVPSARRSATFGRRSKPTVPATSTSPTGAAVKESR